VSAVLFDMDGTLSDGGPGMLSAMQAACRAVGREPISAEELVHFVGPPLGLTMMERLGLSSAECEMAVEAFKHHYYVEGAIGQARPYPGIEEVLRTLSRRGVTLGVATIRSTPSAIRVLETLGLGQYFEGVFGKPSGSDLGKADVVAAGMLHLGVSAFECVMVGDRDIDVYGAKENGLACIGVLWGYGGEMELRQAGAVALARDPADLLELLIGPQDRFGLAR
jgi:phosphoglycolate phosphatase